RKLALTDPTTAGEKDEETRIARQVFKRQYLEERLADAACDLYACACTLSRLDYLLSGNGDLETFTRDIVAGRYFLRLADRRIRHNLAALWDNDDDWTTMTADAALGKKVDSSSPA